MIGLKFSWRVYFRERFGSTLSIASMALKEPVACSIFSCFIKRIYCKWNIWNVIHIYRSTWKHARFYCSCLFDCSPDCCDIYSITKSFRTFAKMMIYYIDLSFSTMFFFNSTMTSSFFVFVFYASHITTKISSDAKVLSLLKFQRYHWHDHYYLVHPNLF